MSDKGEQLTHEEEINLAMRVMARQHEEDLRAGRQWLERQRRLIIIRERDGNDD